ncbi:unnamed protein product [Sympodiomycopsis kandeliae]
MTQEDPSLLVLAGPSHALEASDKKPRFLLLPHPRTGLPTYFLPARSAAAVDQQGYDELYELQAIRSDKKSRSWFLNGGQADQEVLKKGYVIQDGTLHLLLRIDPTFLLLNLLSYTLTSSTYLSVEDLFEESSSKWSTSQLPSQDSRGWQDILDFPKLFHLSSYLANISDIQSETYYRLSSTKIQSFLTDKVKTLSDLKTFKQFPMTMMKSLERQLEFGQEDDMEKRIDITIEIIRIWVPDTFEKILDSVRGELTSHQ